MALALTLLDLPPPNALKSLANEGLAQLCVIGIRKSNLLILIDLPPCHLPTQYKGEHKRLTMPYHGYSLNLLVVRFQEYTTRHPILLWNGDRFIQLQKETTMPKGKPTTKPASTDTKAAIKEDIKEATKPAAQATKPPLLPFPTEPLTPQECLALIYERPFTPVPWETIENCVCPGYEDLFAQARDDGKQVTIQVTPTKDFLFAWIRGNGLNRPRQWSHVQTLASVMRGNDDEGYSVGFDSSCTHFVLTRDNAVANGGHSGPAILCAFFAVTDDEWAGLNLKAKENLSSEYAWVDEDGQQAYLDLLGDDFRVTLVLNAPREAVLKMDDIRLRAEDYHYLEMLPPVIKLMEDYGFNSQELAQIANGLYKRTAQPTPDKENGKEVTKYGTLAKGGRLNASECPIRVATFVSSIIASYAELRSHTDGRKVVFANGLGETGVLSIKDVIVAMSVLDDTQRKRLAKAICKQSDFGKKLALLLTKPTDKMAKLGWQKPNADMIVSLLVSYGLRGDQTEVSKTSVNTDCHNLKNRASGWDRGEANEDGLTRQQVIDEVALTVADLTGNPDLAKTVAKKKERAERAERVAQGDTSRKARGANRKTTRTDEDE